VRQKVDVLDPRNHAYYPGEILSIAHEENGVAAHYKVRIGNDDSWEEDGVVAERLAPEGSKVPRWRLFRPSTALEVKVRDH